jgi:hypothetical protein
MFIKRMRIINYGDSIIGFCIDDLKMPVIKVKPARYFAGQ